jgi:DNA-formamidopyrimidine glycosylase
VIRQVKICGLSTPSTLAGALDEGADFVGFVFFPKSPRHLSLETATHLALITGTRAVKVALLDQRAVAGIGNIYAAEILFRAGIDPRSRCRRLKGDAWQRIATAARKLLAEAVRCEGSSIGDETYRTADNRVGRFQKRHRVYGREGDACRHCRTAVVRIVQTQRSTFFCPECQWHHRRRCRRL